MSATKTDSELLARIVAGADDTTPEPGAWMTPEQLWHALLQMHPATRLERLATLIANSQRAEECFIQNHADRIEWLERAEDGAR